MSWPEILTLAVLPAFLLFDAITHAHAGRVRGWRSRALSITVVNTGLALVVGHLWSRFFGGLHVFDGAAFGTAGGAALGVLVYQFFHYGYHRSAHRFDTLWRLGHQMHHSAESLDPWGAFYLHPLDTALFTTISSLVLFPLLGLSPEAGAWAVALLTFLSVFQHARVRTPTWLGYLIQRPESHAIHHQRGVHAHNYADLPLWDLLFGTFRNGPANAPWPELGFHDGASARIPEMLAFRDVSRARH